MGVHAKKSPSGSGQWFACPGSLNAEEGVPRSESQNNYADEGTAAHELGEYCLRNDTDPYNVPMKSIVVNGVHYPVDIDMQNAVAVYYDYIQGYLIKHGGTLHIEAKVDPGAWMLRDDLFGTSDAGVDGNPIETLVIDYKHGKGIAVDVEENTQLLIYTLGFALPYFSSEKYRLVIVQPRAPHKDGPIREWVISRERLMEFYDELQENVEATDDPNAERIPGKKQCRFCNAQPICPELAQYNLDIAKGEFESIEVMDLQEPIKPVPIATLTLEQTAYILDNANLMTKWIKSVEEHANQEAQRGVKYPGRKLVRKRSHRKFTAEEATLVKMFRSWGLKLADIYTKKLCGPAPIEKLIKPMKDKDIMKAFKEVVEKPEGGLTLVEADDPRTEVEVQSIADSFDDGLYDDEEET